MSSYINHITLPTGHCRRSSRDEVSDETLALLRPWLVSALDAGKPVPLPVELLPDRPPVHYRDYRAKVGRDHIGVMVTIYAAFTIYESHGSHMLSQAPGGKLVPFVALGIAQRSREAEQLWQMMVDTFGAFPGIKMPSVPWCAVASHPGMDIHPDALDSLDWLYDFERCVAWAWITRSPALASVPPTNKAK